MDESLLLKIALVVSVLGIIALYFLSLTFEATDTKVTQLGPEDMGSRVRITGKVTSVKGSSGMKIITIAEESAADIRAYNLGEGIAAGDTVEVIGLVADAEGRRLIEADMIRKTG